MVLSSVLARIKPVYRVQPVSLHMLMRTDATVITIYKYCIMYVIVCRQPVNLPGGEGGSTIESRPGHQAIGTAGKSVLVDSRYEMSF